MHADDVRGAGQELRDGERRLRGGAQLRELRRRPGLRPEPRVPGPGVRGADLGDTPGAEAATGFYFGDPALKREVEQILGESREDGDERLEQLAERFLRRVARGRA